MASVRREVCPCFDMPGIRTGQGFRQRVGKDHSPGCGLSQIATFLVFSSIELNSLDTDKKMGQKDQGHRKIDRGHRFNNTHAISQTKPLSPVGFRYRQAEKALLTHFFQHLRGNPACFLNRGRGIGLDKRPVGFDQPCNAVGFGWR